LLKKAKKIDIDCRYVDAVDTPTFLGGGAKVRQSAHPALAKWLTAKRMTG
jgi:hypothetical protein